MNLNENQIILILKLSPHYKALREELSDKSYRWVERQMIWEKLNGMEKALMILADIPEDKDILLRIQRILLSH